MVMRVLVVVVVVMRLGHHAILERLPKGLADPGELSALTRRSGNPSCKASVSRADDGMETVRSPLHTARRNYVAGDEK